MVVTLNKQKKNVHEKMTKYRKIMGLPNFAMNVSCNLDPRTGMQCEIDYLEESIYKAMVQNKKEEEKEKAKVTAKMETCKNNINKESQEENGLPVFFAGVGITAVAAFIISEMSKHK